ncbi:MAG: four helix bundle protein [Lewinellaceae bacterium]|nr:four helix bundle protein [Lewinellaceae bacterium]HRW76023.1 four helix bundle protein [Saprospiraceae bacterium]
MAHATRFEDLEIWKMGREIAKETWLLTREERWKRQFDLINQMLRSSGSIPDNIAEGFEREGNKEFLQFLSIAKGSCGEYRSQLYRALDRELLTEEEFEIRRTQAENLSGKIQRFMAAIRRSDLSGSKYK